MKAERLMKEFGLSGYDAQVLCSDFELGKLFDKMILLKTNPTVSAKLLTRELLSVLNHDSLVLKDLQIDALALVELVKLLEECKVSNKNSKQSVINYISGDKSKPKDFLEKNSLLISASINLDEVVLHVISANEKAVSDFRAGNEKSLNFLAGLVMKETKGTANPQKVQEVLREKISKK
ncbi:MAG: Asp-tRNA(Asn)/Glu-tRNA(Gln) amidotransferase GatCAB subunit B, partial [Candidatus Diapherotrites archaeon]|nr:Asp-tRNA(Asn)/Glu-tRNA(Gln) amidotransferase GatCAB subunit B [Candidatus Diapherotrites archaeon]